MSSHKALGIREDVCFATSSSSCPTASSELVRDLSLKLELTLSNDNLVIISSRVEAAMGRAVRMELRELLGDDTYRLLDPAGDL